MIVSWKMRRVMGKDVKWAGFDMEIWTGPSDRTCSQPQLGKRSLPSPAFLHQHCPSGLKLCEAEEGWAVGRCLPYCCHCVAAVASSSCDRRCCASLPSGTLTGGLWALGIGANKGFHARSKNYYYYCSKTRSPSAILASAEKKKKEGKNKAELLSTWERLLSNSHLAAH